MYSSDVVDASVSVGQRRRTAGRAILGKGGGAARHSRVDGLLRATGFAGVQAALAVGGDSAKHPEHICDCRLGGSVQ